MLGPFDLYADPKIREGWLDVTHPLTFANAVRLALRNSAASDRHRALFFAAHFIQRRHPLALAPEQRSDPEGAPASGQDFEALVLERVVGDDFVRPIVVAHILKTGLAALAESRELATTAFAERPLLAVLRMLDSPVRERQIRRACNEAAGFILEQTPPPRRIPG